VVDKLLTGFDAPRNTVLYLARRLKDHSLLQAIARVNRLYEDESGSKAKDFGYIIDYVGVLGELDQALTTYSALEGFEEADLKVRWPRSMRKPRRCRSAMPNCGTCSRR
jgi:type I restriction enzyme R subunit